jgi:hypothetical protein
VCTDRHMPAVAVNVMAIPTISAIRRALNTGIEISAPRARIGPEVRDHYVRAPQYFRAGAARNNKLRTMYRKFFLRIFRLSE